MRLPCLAASVVLAAAFAAPAAARPGAPAPRGGPASPPPAWIEASGGDRWLLFSSYCWTRRSGRPVAACVDYLNPSMRPDVPRIVLEHGELVRLHLGFKPSVVRLELAGRTHRLAATATPAWRVAGRGGVATLTARVRGNSASYVARFVIRSSN